MMKKKQIIACLKADKHITGYELSIEDKDSRELFYFLDHLEINRAVNTKEVYIKVYVSDQKTTGVSTVVVTAADDEMDIVRGLDIGGDDYITKPFKLAILISRINALLRRSQDFTEEDILVRSGEISIDKLKGEVLKNGKRIELTTSEYKLLLYFVENSGVVLSSNQILGHLWDYDERYVDANTLTVYIRRLRTKIEDNPSSPKNILTVRGRGYKWNEEKGA